MFRHPYPVLEPILAVAFLVAVVDSARRGRWPLLVILSAAFYGLLLEEGDMLIFRSYHYSPDFILAVDRVPLIIALSWAIIITTCMRLTDAYGIPARWAPFADALWAIILDLSFDAIAIRLGLWTWDIRLDQGLLGVPAGNFYAWLLVAFTFSYFTRRVGRGGRPVRQLAVPFLAYGALLAGMVPFILLKRAFFDTPGGGLPLFWAAFAVCLAATAWGLARRRFPGASAYDPLSTLARLSFHAFFLAGLLSERLYEETPGLLVLALVMLALEALAEMPVHLRRRRPRPPVHTLAERPAPELPRLIDVAEP